MEAAIKSYKQALVLRPDFPEATCNLLHTLQVNQEMIFVQQFILVGVSIHFLLFTHRNQSGLLVVVSICSFLCGIVEYCLLLLSKVSGILLAHV